MPLYNVEINGNFSSQFTLTASSQQEAVNLAAQDLISNNPHLYIECDAIEVYPQQYYTSLSQYYSQPQPQPQPQPQAYTPFRQSASRSYIPYRR